MSTPGQPTFLHDIQCMNAMGHRSREYLRTDRAEDALTDAEARGLGKSPWLVRRPILTHRQCSVKEAKGGFPKVVERIGEPPGLEPGALALKARRSHHEINDSHLHRPQTLSTGIRRVQPFVLYRTTVLPETIFIGA